MLTYGLDKSTGKTVDIRNAANGLGCNCVCPHCGDLLVANQGKVKDWHFSHHNGDTCAHAVESALHLRAKEILAESSYIYLPSLVLDVSEYPPSLDRGTPLKKEVISPDKKFEVETVVLERKVDNFRPDLIVYIQGRPLLIEIAVTHFVDAEKLKKIKTSDLSCIEIDLSSFKDKEISDEKFRSILLSKPRYAQWIYNSKKHSMESRFIKEIRKDIERTIEFKKGKLKSHLEFYFSREVIVNASIVEAYDKDYQLFDMDFQIIGSSIFNNEAVMEGQLTYTNVGGGNIHISFSPFGLKMDGVSIFSSDESYVFDEVLMEKLSIKLALEKELKKLAKSYNGTFI